MFSKLQFESLSLKNISSKNSHSIIILNIRTKQKLSQVVLIITAGTELQNEQRSLMDPESFLSCFRQSQINNNNNVLIMVHVKTLQNCLEETFNNFNFSNHLPFTI